MKHALCRHRLKEKESGKPLRTVQTRYKLENRITVLIRV